MFLGSKSPCVLILILYFEFCLFFLSYCGRKKTELNFYAKQMKKIENFISEKNEDALAGKNYEMDDIQTLLKFL